MNEMPIPRSNNAEKFFHYLILYIFYERLEAYIVLRSLILHCLENSIFFNHLSIIPIIFNLGFHQIKCVVINEKL